MINRINLTIAFIAAAIFATLLLLINSQKTFGSLSSDTPSNSNIYRTFDLFASTTVESVTATSTNATSTNIVAYADSNGRIINGSADIRGAKKIDVYFTRGGTFAAANTGTSTFAIQISPDGTNWYYYNRLVVSTSTSASNISNSFIAASDPTMNTPITIGATTPGNIATSTLHYFFDSQDLNFKNLRCISTILVDGANSCQVSVTY